MKLTCIKKIDNFTLNKSYKLLGVGGEWVELKGDDKKACVVNEIYFTEKKKKRMKGWIN